MYTRGYKRTPVFDMGAVFYELRYDGVAVTTIAVADTETADFVADCIVRELNGRLEAAIRIAPLDP